MHWAMKYLLTALGTMLTGLTTWLRQQFSCFASRLKDCASGGLSAALGCLFLGSSMPELQLAHWGSPCTVVLVLVLMQTNKYQELHC